MSVGPDGMVRTVGFPLGEDEDGRSVVAYPYSRDAMVKSIEEGLASKLRDADAVTEDPDTEDGEVMSEGGPIRRWNDVFTDLGSVQLEQVAMDGHEIANATATLRNEMYRSKFPLVLPRFTVKCRDDDCGAEYDEDVDFCLQCARREMEEAGVANPPTDPSEIPEKFADHPVRYPDPAQKRNALRQAESVNKEGQSLRELMKELEDDQSRLGVSVMVVKHKYWVNEETGGVFARGEVVKEEADELVRGDPKHIVPVVDENGRAGNYWYTCPVHRLEARTKHQRYVEGEDRCDECGCRLREVRYVEQPYTRSGRGSKPDKYYFENEIITWARYFPRLHGLDGLSPVHHVWVKQAILHWMDIYGAAYFDPQSDRLPHKFIVVHTTNPDAWERNFEKAEVEAKENPYNNQVFMNEFSSESRSTPEVQVIDLMSDNLIGQDEQMRDRYKQDIRTQFGVMNIFDSEMKDAGGLNNEGLQLEVTDRAVATAMLDTEQGPLDELAKTIEFSDYYYAFVPPEETDVEDLRANIQTGMDASKAGLDARMEDNKVRVDDGDFQEEEGGGAGGLAGLFQQAEDAGAPEVWEKAVGDDPWSAETRWFRVVAPEGEEDEYNDRVLGVGVDFPEAGVYVDWHRDAFPDALDEPHVSEYGSVSDLRKATGNDVVDVERPPGASYKFDPMADPHQYDPGEERVYCEASGEDWRAPTWGDLEGDCPHCGGPLLAFDPTEGKARRGETPDPGNETDGTERTPSEKETGEKAREKASSWEGEEGKAQGGRWEPYRGPQGGEGWKHAKTGEVRYTDEPPGKVDPLSEDVAHAIDELDEGWSARAGAVVSSMAPERQVQLSRFAARAGDKALKALLRGLSKHGDELIDVATSMMAEEAEGPADYKSDGRRAQLKLLDDAFEHIVWADETSKAEPFWDDSESVPRFVMDLVLDAIGRSLYQDIESLPQREMDRLERVFKRRLTQPQGWSLGSLSQDIEDAFGVPPDDAELIARTESASILNNAREEGYRELGVEGAVFRWIGPHDHRTTDACEWMKEVTDKGAGEMVAEYGPPDSVDTMGEPVSLDDLIALEREATEKFFPHLDFRKHTIHPRERHSFVETFKAVVLEPAFPAADPRGLVEYEVDFKLNMAPAMGGTFVAA